VIKMSLEECTTVGNNIKDTPFGYTLSLIGGKWKMIIMYCIAEKPGIRYNALQRCIGAITYRTLSLQLKELEQDGIVIRKEYPQVPPKVEYYLSKRGQSLIPILDVMCLWGQENQL
jgi:DNA-binding HxlR family transcriptional regulator